MSNSDDSDTEILWVIALAVGVVCYIIAFTVTSVFETSGAVRIATGLLGLVGFIGMFLGPIGLLGFWTGFSLFMAIVLFLAAIKSFFTGEILFDIEVNV